MIFRLRWIAFQEFNIYQLRDSGIEEFRIALDSGHFILEIRHLVTGDLRPAGIVADQRNNGRSVADIGIELLEAETGRYSETLAHIF